MKAPNKYITIIFILSVSYGIYNLINPSGKKSFDSWDTKTDQALELSKSPLEPGVKLKGKSGPEYDMDKKDERKMLPWGKDPFIFPEGMDPYNRKSNKKATPLPEKKVKKVVKRKEKPLSVKITSILISDGQKVATIDRAPYVVTVGDWIENLQVLEILPDRVIFGGEGKRQEILMKSRLKVSKKSRGKNEP
ncbi:MAG: hypothetical protein ACMUIU_09160 [bacterium]